MSYITNDDRSIQKKKINGEWHVKVGFGEWLPMSEVGEPTYQPTESDRMDLRKTGDPSKATRSSSIREWSIPQLKSRAKY